MLRLAFVEKCLFDHKKWKGVKNLLMLLVLPLAMLTSCKDDEDNMIWDFAPWNVVITATDTPGVDLFEETMPGELFATYNGMNYPLTEDSRTRDIMPKWNGLIKVFNFAAGLNTVVFGEFTPEDDYKNEPFTLNWQDGTSVEITFDCYITWEGKKPTVHASAKVNGKASWTDPKSGMVISVFMKRA